MFVLWAAQMAPFDAINHAMTSIATGGFSTRDASIGAYPPLIQWILFVAMIIGSLPFVFYIDAVRGRFDPLAKDSQVRVFLGVLAIAILLVFLWLVFDRGEGHGCGDHQGGVQRDLGDDRHRLCHGRLRQVGARSRSPCSSC